LPLLFARSPPPPPVLANAALAPAPPTATL